MAPNKTLTEQSAALQKRLSAIPQEILEALRPALMQSGYDVATAAKTFAEASRDTGSLIDSIAVTGPGETTPSYAEGGGKRTAGPNQVLVTVGNEDMRHGHFVEFGTVNQEPQEFLRPGFRTVKPRIERRINRAISTVIKKNTAR